MSTRNKTVHPKESTETAAPQRGPVHELDQLRAQIRELDRSIIDLIAERVRLAQRIGETKRAAGLGTLDPAREAAVVRHAGTLAREARLDPEDIRPLFWRIIGLSRRAQQTEDAGASLNGSTATPGPTPPSHPTAPVPPEESP